MKFHFKLIYCHFCFVDTVFKGCHRKNEFSCKGAIKTLKTKHGFWNCDCESEYHNSPINFRSCEILLNILNNHPCLLQQPKYLPDSKIDGIDLSKNPTKPTEIELDKLSKSNDLQKEQVTSNKC